MEGDEPHREEDEGQPVLEHQPVDGAVHRAVWAAQGEADNSRRYLSSRVAEQFRVAGKVDSACESCWLVASVLVPLARAESSPRTLVIEKPGEREHRSVTAEPLTPAVATTTSQKTCAARFGLSALTRSPPPPLSPNTPNHRPHEPWRPS